MDALIVFARLDSPEIHLLNVVISTNVWIIHAEQIQFVLTLPAAMTVNVNVDFSEIHIQCVHQFNKIPNVMIQIIVCVVKLLLAHRDIDVKMVIV